MTSTGTLRIMSWNVRGFGTSTRELKEEISKQKPHLLVMQETRRWIQNDKEINWPGAKVYNVPPVQMTRGNKGGLAIVVCPELKSQEIYYTNPVAEEYELEDNTRDPYTTEQTSINHAEQLMPEEDLDVATVINVDMVAEAGEADLSPVSSQTTNWNSLTRREKRELARRRSRQPTRANGAPVDNTGQRDADRNKELIQAITVQLENGFRLTGAYIGPQTRKSAVEEFITKSLNENGNNHLICGDMNARHCTWDKACNERGAAIHKLVSETPNTHIVAADVPSYHKVIKKAGGELLECSSNPDIGISRAADTSARTADRNWGKISDHRHVMFTVRTRVALRDMRRRVAKSLFYAPKAIENAKKWYAGGEAEMSRRIEELKEGKEEEAKLFFTHMERFVTEPWEKCVRTRGPRKELWWSHTIGKAHQRRKQLARKWHSLAMSYRTNRTVSQEADIKKAHTEVKEQKRHVRRLERQAKAGFNKMTADKLREAGLTDQSKAIKRDHKGKARRRAEAKRNGRQLCPATFTKYMGQEQGSCEPMLPRHFTLDNRRMRRRISAAIMSMERHKAVGVDNVHAEMLQAAPRLFARILAQLWAKVGQTLLVPESWTTGLMVPLLKKGAQADPANYRPLCMLSHVRKFLEKAITAELEQVLKTDRMQFGFQCRLNILQAALEIAACVEQETGKLLAVLDLAKAYDKVIRRLLVQKLLDHGVPENLVNQIIIFLLPLHVKTAGDLTETIAILTTGLVQGGTASPALFRFFINDLAGDLREAKGEPREPVHKSINDPGKLVADDVILIANSAGEMQKLLDACTFWACKNRLVWKPAKCHIISAQPEAVQEELRLAGQELQVVTEANYLGIVVTANGFTKRVGSHLETKCIAACSAITSQQFFDAGLPLATIRALYRTNVRSIILYGATLCSATASCLALPAYPGPL